MIYGYKELGSNLSQSHCRNSKSVATWNSSGQCVGWHHLNSITTTNTRSKQGFFVGTIRGIAVWEICSSGHKSMACIEQSLQWSFEDKISDC
ncbi:Uncharacterized protein HZ326_25542 [Fusarium oxysporum f. sp. albedinis]|nr:Uncharacterized protein HZ326_25542 [Fusarium oxysporum f. sp. albedinis]